MRRGSLSLRLGALTLIAGLSACVSRPPSIAHVHIGHALTGVHVTPDHKGYLLVAEQRADEALADARSAQASPELAKRKVLIAQALNATDSQQDFGLKQSLIMAANHITFAATSPDASDNVRQSAPIFAGSIAAVIQRCDTISLLGKDVAAATSSQEADVLTAEIVKLAQSNVQGDDANGDGVLGSTLAEYGMAQLRQQLQSMIARENPPYRTVDQWYLFNLVRLPNGRWVFDKLGRGGNIDGYK